MSNPLAKLVVRIGADFGDMKTAFKEANTAAVKLGRKMQSVGKGLTTYVTGPMLAAGAAIGVLASKTAAYGDRIDKLSQRLGMSRDAFQQWDFVLSQNGVNIESMQMGMKSLSQRMEEASRGAGMGADLFGRLGVSVKDSEGAMRSQEDVFLDTVRAFEGMADGVEKAAIAQKLFGRNGQELLPMLNQATGSADALMKKAVQLGLVMGDDVVDAGVRFTDSVDALKRQFGAVSATLGAKLIPLLERSLFPLLQNVLLPAVLVLANGIGKLVDAFLGLSTGMKVVVGSVTGFLVLLGPMTVGLGTLLVVLPKVKAALMTINRTTLLLTAKIIAITAVVAAFAAAAYLIHKNWGGVSKFFRDLWRDVVSATGAAMGLVQSKVEAAFLRLIRTMSGLGAKLLEPSRRIAEALGADDIAARVAAIQDRIRDVVSEGAVRTAENRARSLGAALGRSMGGIADTFRGAGSSVASEVGSLVDQVRTTVSGLQGELGAVADGAGAALGGTEAGSSSGLARQLAEVEVVADRVGNSMKRLAARVPSVLGMLRQLATIENPEAAAAGRRLRERRAIGADVRDVAGPSMGRGDVELVYSYQVAFDALRSSVSGVSRAIGDAVSELFTFRNPIESIQEAALSLGRSLGQVFRSVVSDIAAAIAKALILKGLLALTGGGGFLGGALSSLVGGANAMAAAPSLKLEVSVVGGEMRMGNGYLAAALDAHVVQQSRMGVG